MGSITIARTTEQNSKQESLHVKFKIGSNTSFTMSCCPDTGAETIVMGQKDFLDQALDKKIKLFQKNPLNIHGIDGKQLHQEGYFYTDLEVEGNTSKNNRGTVSKVY